MLKTVYTFKGNEFRVEYETLQEAELESHKYPPSIFKREGNTYVCDHQTYLNYLDRGV